MFIPRITAIGLGISGGSIALGGLIGQSVAPPKPGNGMRLSDIAGASLAGAGAVGSLGFGLWSPAKGLRPVAAMLGVMMLGTAVGFGGGSAIRAATGS